MTVPDQGFPEDIETAAERIRVRRGAGLLLISVLLPGTAQLVAGNRTVGRWAVRIDAAVLAVVVVLAGLALASRSAFISLVTSRFVLDVLVALLCLAALGWAALLVDAWRLAYPPALDRGHRRVFAAMTLAGVVLVTGTLGVGARAVATSTTTLGKVFGGGGVAQVTNGRINVLLLGADAGQTRVGLRPDSITVASVDADTGRTVLFSLPRNLEDVPFPESSPMHRLYPDGFTCAEHACLINAIYTEATAAAQKDPSLYPGVADPGAQATKEAVEEITGLSINYYAMVDMDGFRSLVDALGGITLDISRDVPIGGGSSQVTGWIRAGEDVHLDGYRALWFARSREGSSDFERMQRQKCVMAAVLNQADPLTVVTKFDALARAGGDILVTDVPRGQIGPLSDLALKARHLPIASVSFVPPLVYPGSPKFDVIRETVRTRLDRAEQLDRERAEGGTSTADATPTVPATPTRPAGSSPTASRSATPSASSDSGTPEPQADDLDSVCRVA